MLMRVASPADAFLQRAAVRLRAPADDIAGALRFGVDLGTATIVLAAIDESGEPVWWDFVREGVVRDGVVVDFPGAVKAVAQLKRQAEATLGRAVDEAATAHPPAVSAADCRACAFVLQQAGIECRSLVDEVSAANAVLGIRDGAVVDVGGGSTGVGVFAGGGLLRLSDRAGGGHHLDLIIAGRLRLAVEDAEAHKRAHGEAVLDIVRPGIERIAESIRLQCGDVDPVVVHLAGGALRIPGADAVIERYLGWETRSYPNSELITPFGIAAS